MQPYEERAAADQERYQREVAAYPGGTVPRKVSVKKQSKAYRLQGSAQGSAVATGNRGRSSYAFFVMAARPILVRENPTLAFADLSRLVAQRWAALSDAEKQPYIDLANAEKEAKRSAA